MKGRRSRESNDSKRRTTCGELKNISNARTTDREAYSTGVQDWRPHAPQYEESEAPGIVPQAVHRTICPFRFEDPVSFGKWDSMGEVRKEERPGPPRVKRGARARKGNL